jgi:plastocyanin
MTFFVKVVAPADYAAWVKRQTLKAFGGDCEPSGPDIQLVAENTSWNTTCLAVRAGQPFSITVTNKDQGVDHNFAIWPSVGDSFSGNGELFESGRFPGVASRSFQVTTLASLPPGRYYFQCDVHGVAMAGAFLVR